jgi:TonB family protein
MIKTVVAALLLPFATVSATPPVIAVNTPQPVSERSLIAWDPGEIRCEGAIVTPAFLERPMASLSWVGPAQAAALTYAFDIDPSGRTMNIRKAAADARAIGADDIAPSLAASRFAAGKGHSDCTMAYTQRQTSLAAAPLADLTAYSVNAISGPLPKEAWERMQSDSDCRDVRALGLKNRAFPNFQGIASTPGVRNWSMVEYDIADNGVTKNIRTVAGTRNAALDAASRKAVEQTRYYKGGRKGCRYPYWRSPATLPAPLAPEEDAFRPAGSTCTDRVEWSVPPRSRFPEPYRRRAIEGWAVVSYDVAPWGEVSNIKVLASQPTEDFGTQAIGIVRGGKVAAPEGFVGCAELVRFEMGPGEEDNK